jgi:hypothetical protein
MDTRIDYVFYFVNILDGVDKIEKAESDPYNESVSLVRGCSKVWYQ